MSNSSIQPLARTLSGATTPGQSGSGNNGNEGIFYIPQSSVITGASPSNCLVSYSRLSLKESYFSAEMQSVYSTAPANWAVSQVRMESAPFVQYYVQSKTADQKVPRDPIKKHEEFVRTLVNFIQTQRQ